MRLSTVLFTVAVVTATAGSAFAQTGAANPAKKDTAVQVMDFPDADQLKTSGDRSFGTTITPGHGPVRVLLVRPRVSFVPEMYKSIENL